ncbi:MAG: putative Ig domain-containing protein, partial [Pedobacter sp.]|nr:putative Ig domain-containing protein [Pedobacter sp.]
MKRNPICFLTVLVTVFFLLTSQFTFAQDNYYLGNGSDGALIVSNGSFVTPSVCSRLTSAAPIGQSFVTVASTTGFAVGDLIMVLQATGLTGQTSGNQSNITLNGNVGQYELKRVTALTSTRLTFTGSALTNAYLATNAQVVSVKEYTTVNVQSGGSISAANFDGLQGGIIAFLATGAVTINGTVGVNGLGPVGGSYGQSVTGTYTSLDATSSTNAGRKGYGVALLTSGTTHGYGNQANGGGGGNANNGGGGGGANAGKGGNGGMTSGNGANEAYGGLGGASLTYSPVSRLVFGGSGGAGHGVGTSDNFSSIGGAGGGIIWVRAASIDGSGQINAGGGSGHNAQISAGGGGGGAGGTICLRASGTIASSLIIRAMGGDGGLNFTANVAPGGGGGGGRIYVQAAGYSGAPIVNGGVAGNDTNNSLFGASGGYVGEVTINTDGLVNPATPVLTSPLANATVNTLKPNITGTATAGSTVSIYIDNVLNGTATTDGSGNFSYTPAVDLSEGTHSIAAQAELVGLTTARTTGYNFTTVVTPVAPTNILLSATAVNENVVTGTTVATLSSTDANGSDTFTYSLISGTGDTDNATFSIAGNQLNINVSPDFETKSTYSIRIRTTDSGNLTFEKSFTIAINNVVEAPTTITLTPASFPENVSFGTVVGTLNVDGDFYSARDFFLTLGGTGSDDNGLFGMRDEGNGIFKLYWGSATPPDFEGLHGSIYKIRIVYYQNVTSLERPLTLMLTNVDEAPTDLSLSANSINENVVANSTIGTFTTTDADGGDTFTYSLVSGDGASDNGSFTIDGNALKIVPSPDFETKNSYSIRVRTTDASGKTFDKIFAITINDVQEAVITVGGTLSNFAAIQGSASAAQSFTVAGTGLTEGILVTSPSGYEVSKDNSTFSTTVTVGSAGTVATTTIYVRLSAAATIGSYNGNIQITSAGAQSRQFGLVGTVSLAKRYVTTTGAGTKDGSSWANASDDLRNALLSSIAGGEVWVAKGTYKPTSTTDRTINFSIPNGVAVYGGFAGTETATDQRNIKLNPTVLSGDIGIPGNNMDNSYHLFLIQSNTLPTTLDGFTITDGSSIGMASGIHSEGAGLLISNVRDLSLKNLIITKNTSSNEGGGVYIYHNTSGSNTITFTQVSFIQNKGLNYGGGGLNISGTQTATINLDRCIFDGNLVLSTNGSVGTGGAIQIESPNAIAALTNCLFVNNRAGGQGDDGGGAIMNYGGTVSVTNSTLYNNTTGSTSFPDGNSLSIASTGAINVINSIIWGTAAKHINKPSGAINLTNSLVKGEMVSSPNLNSDPLFVNTNNLTGADGLFGTADDGLNLRYSSPAKNNGTANNAPNIDLAGTARPQGAAIDMGAYETNSPQPVISNTTANGLTAVYGSAPIAGSFNLSGTGMDAGILVTAPANFEVSLNMSSGFADAITVGTGDNIFAPVYVRLKSDLSAGSYAGNIVLTSLSATSVNVAVSCTNSKAGLTITAKNINKTYGTALMALTGSTEFTSTGLQNSETIGTVSIAYGDGADAAGTVGTHTGAVTASDAIGGTFNPANYDITYVAGNIIIDAPLIAVIPASLSSGTVAAPYHAALTASGGIGTYTFNVTTGSLPAGITLAADGTLSGTPTAGGSFTFTVTATDGSLSGGPYTGSQVYVWVVSPPAISITNTSLPIGAVGTTYSQTIMASGGTVPYSYGVTAGALPPGITLASDGTLSGTPTGEGTYNCTITAFDSSTGTGAPYSGSRAFSLTIAPPNVQIATLTLASGTVGEAYTQTLIAAGGTPAYTYTVTAGMLPMGLNLATNGVLSGTPTTKGTFNVTITARDASGTGPYAGSRAYAITIGAGAQVITFSPIADQTYGAAPITLNASSSAGITVTFNSSNTNVATITNNILSIVGAGSTTITASQIGDNNYNAATDVQQTLNVGKASQAITFNTLADQTFGDAAFDLNATGGASGNAITYTISNTNVATITGNKVTIIGAGTTTIQASQAGNANYNAASDVGQTLNVGKAPQAITFPVLANKSVGDAPFDLNATAGASGNAITYTISNTNVATITGNKVT